MIILLFVVLLGRSQSSPREYLYNKADSLVKLEKFSQARYYYLLSVKQKGEFPSDKKIKQMVVVLDSSLAYASTNGEFIELIAKADSLLSKEKYIEALKFFDDASSLEPAFDYPHARIDQIIETSEEIKKKLLIYNAKQNQLGYSKMLSDIQNLEEEQFYVEAYFKYKEFAKIYHMDSVAIMHADAIYSDHAELIEKLLVLLDEGEEHYFKGEFESAKSKFEEALFINPKNQRSKYRLSQIEYCLKQDLNQKESFDQNLTNAKSDFKTGKYERAYYQFSWLNKQQPDNVEVATYVVKLEELLEAETDERMRKFNADITLEKANNEFMAGDFDGALELYSKLKNAYADAIDYLQFVELRIAECLKELE